MKKRVVALLCFGVVTALQAEWKLDRDRDEVKVYTRRVEGIAFKQYKGETIVKSRLSTLVAIFEDMDAAVEWVDTCDRMELLERISPQETYTYSYNGAPWPAKDRDAVVHNLIEQDPETLVVTITQKGVPDRIPENKKAVRVERIEGLWIFEPLSGGKVKITYQVLSDPGGGLPAWLVNSVAVSQPHTTLVGFREMVQLEKYQISVFEFIKEPAAE